MICFADVPDGTLSINQHTILSLGLSEIQVAIKVSISSNAVLPLWTMKTVCSGTSVLAIVFIFYMLRILSALGTVMNSLTFQSLCLFAPYK